MEDDIYDAALEIFDTPDLYHNKIEHSKLINELLDRGFEFDDVEKLLDDMFKLQLRDANAEKKGFENISKEEFIKYFNEIKNRPPTNVEITDDLVIGKDSTGLDVKLSVSDDGYIQLWRATDDPSRLVISDFEKTGSGGRSGLGQQNYFSATPEYADEYSGGNRKLFQFETKIKPNEILNIDLSSLRNTHPELVSLFYDVEAPGGPIRLKGNIQSNIGKLKELGYKAVGTSATGNQRVGQVQFEIIPLIEDLDETYGIKSLNTPTNVVNTGDYIDEDLADGDMMNAQYDSEIEIPDTVPEDLVEEVDRERFREFLELQEPEGTVLYDDADRVDTFKNNLIDADDTNTIESFAEIAKNEKLPTYEDVVNQYNQQLDNVVDNMPIEKIAKKKLKDKVLELSTRLLTPGGAMDLVDAYETIVFGLGIMVAAAPELKNIASYYSTLAANHIGKAYGMNIPVDKLEPDWKRINKVMDQVEAVTPTDILINKVMDREQKGNTYVSSYLPGFLPQSTIKNDDVATTLENTLMNMPINKGKTETSSDKLKESLIYGSTK
jgi:hypothetical protein